MILPQFISVEDSDIVAFKTVFGWAILGSYTAAAVPSPATVASVSHVVHHPSTDDLLCKFWETEEVSAAPCLSPEERSALKHFNITYVFLPEGHFQVQLPRKPDAPTLGESCLQAVDRFHANEASISSRGTWQAFQDVIQEDLDLGHAEPVPAKDLTLPPQQMYYANACGHQKQQHHYKYATRAFKKNMKPNCLYSTFCGEICHHQANSPQKVD